jgi:hypothetical protein
VLEHLEVGAPFTHPRRSQTLSAHPDVRFLE